MLCFSHKWTPCAFVRVQAEKLDLFPKEYPLLICIVNQNHYESNFLRRLSMHQKEKSNAKCLQFLLLVNHEYEAIELIFWNNFHNYHQRFVKLFSCHFQIFHPICQLSRRELFQKHFQVKPKLV